MGGLKKQGGFNRGGNPRVQRVGQSSHDGGHSDRPRFGGERGGFSRSGRSMGSRDGSLQPQMFSAVCSDCNRKCEVPFRPTGDRPVFCNDCFSNKRGASQDGNPRRDSSARDFPRRDFTPSTSSAPAKPYTEDKRIDELKWQLDGVNKKLDTVIEMMRVAHAIEAAKVTLAKTIKATREPGERSHDSAKASLDCVLCANRKALGQNGSSRRMTVKKLVKVKK